MDFELPDEADPRRVEVRDWIAAHPAADGPTLAAAGYVAPHWPKPYGLDADPITQLIIDDELRRAGIRRPSNPIGIGWAGPTLLHAGTPEQQQQWLPRLLSGEDTWCQLFSEPDAGSDLASLTTRAVRDGDEWVVNGQKIWTSLGHISRWGILIARTNPDAGKHHGITYFVVDMHSPGIEISPIVEMTGAHNFNQVFFTDLRVPDTNRVGEVDKGWSLAKVTLGNERVSLSDGGALWGMGPTAGDLLDEVRAAGGTDDPLLRARLAGLHIEAEILRLIRMRTLTARIKGTEPGPEASIRKIKADEHGQEIMALAKDLSGPDGMLDGGPGTGPLGGDPAIWHFGYLFSQALTIGGGTGQVQRNIVDERVLGLPHDT
jgi:alkylation response protein AidB-like acyl-CoA dehydrogenase